MVRKFFSLVLILVFASCEKEEIDLSQVDYITLTPLVSQVYLGSEYALELNPQAYDRLGNAVEVSGWKILANGEKVSKDFKPENAGSYEVWGKLGAYISDTVLIEAVVQKDYERVDFDMVVHVVNLPDLDLELIYESYQHANNAYSNKLGSENPNAQNVNFHFNLVDKDPEGNLLVNPGIYEEENIPADVTLADLQAIKKKRQWNPDQYINVWIAEVHPNAWANLPSLDEGHGLSGLDSIPEDVKSILSMVNVMPVQLGGDNNTLTHELGHFFGLFHVFTTHCLYDNDYCNDTPKYVHPGKNDLPYESCNGLEFYRDNHMDYTNDPTYTFTYQQVERMRHVLNYGRYIGNKRGLEYVPF
jgi:hypothetical protein